jgi:hypothetical protein
LGLTLVLLGSGAVAQERETSDEQERPFEPRKIRVLNHPYDIASFYRSSQSSGSRYFAYQEPGQTSVRNDPYAIARYYRSDDTRRDMYGYGWGYGSDQGYGYGRYWGASRRAPRGIIGVRRRINSRTDLFLIAPTFLAPVGPLSVAFLGR